MDIYDIAVIGSGPGGYVAAIRAVQLGYKTVIIEKFPTLGGTCTNVGCIPTKALLDSTHHYYEAYHQFKTHGIEVDNLRLNFNQLYKRKDEVVLKNTQGLDYLMKKNKIIQCVGTASFINNFSVEVTDNRGGKSLIYADKFIVATGSKPADIPGVNIDKKRIISSTEALSMKEQPQKIVIIGGGVIGLEMASIFNRIGTQVTILEYANRLLPTMDSELGKTMYKLLKKEGIDIQLGQQVYKTENLGDFASVYWRDKEGEKHSLKSDYVLVAVGRKAYTQNLGLENTDVQ